jgi:hypothetical protein
MTDLSAGGLRSRGTVGATHRPKDARAGCVGADPGNGLAAAEWPHARTNCGRPSAPVLGSEACRVFGTERSRNANSASDEAALLYSKRVLLGRSDFVSSRRALEGCSGFCVLERSGSSNRPESRELLERTTLINRSPPNRSSEFDSRNPKGAKPGSHQWQWDLHRIHGP